MKTHYNVYFTGVKMTNYWVRSPSVRMTSVLIFHVASPVEQKQDNWIIFFPPHVDRFYNRTVCGCDSGSQCVLLEALIDCVCTERVSSCMTSVKYEMFCCMSLGHMCLYRLKFPSFQPAHRSVLILKAEFVISIFFHRVILCIMS